MKEALSRWILKFSHKNATKWAAAIVGMLLPWIEKLLIMDEASKGDLATALVQTLSILIVSLVAFVASKFVGDYQHKANLTVDEWAGPETRKSLADK